MKFIKKIYFATAITIALILGIIGFLLVKSNGQQKTDAFSKPSISLQNDDKNNKNIITITFENEDHFPLKNNDIIPKPIILKENEVYLPIKKIIFNHKINLNYFETINNSKLNKIVSASVIVKLIAKKQYRQWFTIRQLNEKLLKQVNFSSKYIDRVVSLISNRNIKEQEIVQQLKLMLVGSNKKYLDLLRKFTVFDET